MVRPPGAYESLRETHAQIEERQELVDDILARMADGDSRYSIEPSDGGFVLVRTFEGPDAGQQKLYWTASLDEMQDNLIQQDRQHEAAQQSAQAPEHDYSILKEAHAAVDRDQEAAAHMEDPAPVRPGHHPTEWAKAHEAEFQRAAEVVRAAKEADVAKQTEEIYERFSGLTRDADETREHDEDRDRDDGSDIDKDRS